MAIIFHIDMDAFFVACELLEKPELAGKPIVVGADPKGGKGRGVVSTCSYEARKFGVRSGMPISTAYRLCPDCIFLPVNFTLYANVSKKVFALIRNHVVKLERVSIDEAFFITNDKIYEESEKTAKEIKKIICKEGLTCSIGIGPNKNIAKIASDFKKPDGLTLIRPNESKKFLAELPVRKLPGIGPKTEHILNSLGIKTIGDIARDERRMADLFGKWGSHLYLLANGYGDELIEEQSEAKSISRETTFQRDTNDTKLIDKTIEDLSQDLYDVISHYNLSVRSICIKLRYSDFETHTKQKTLKYHINDLQSILKTSRDLIKPFLKRKKIRLIGLRLSGFSGSQQNIKKFLRY